MFKLLKILSGCWHDWHDVKLAAWTRQGMHVEERTCKNCGLIEQRSQHAVMGKWKTYFDPNYKF